MEKNAGKSGAFDWYFKTNLLVRILTGLILGAAVGIVLGVAGSWIIGAVINIKPVLEIKIVLFAVIVSSGIGIIFGTYPAKKAADLNPIEALRHE